MRIFKYFFLLYITSLSLGSMAGPICTDDIKESNKSLNDFISKESKILIPLDQGRKTFLAWMHYEPEQLTKDLERVELYDIKIGQNSILDRIKSWFGYGPKKPSALPEKSPCEKYNILSEKLKSYTTKLAPKLNNTKNLDNTQNLEFLGMFRTSEIIYAMAQTFAAPPAGQGFDDPFFGGTWVPLENKDKPFTLYYTFIFTPKDNNLTVQTVSEKTLTHIDDISEKRPRTMFSRSIGSVIFDLSKGTTKFAYEYTFGKKTKKWQGNNMAQPKNL